MIKSSSDIDNKEIFPVSDSSSQKVWSSFYSENGEEEIINNNNTDISDSYILERPSFLVCNFWEKRKLHINTDFVVTGWMLHGIPHNRKYARYHSDSNYRKHVNDVIKIMFHGLSEDEMDFKPYFFWTE